MASPTLLAILAAAAVPRLLLQAHVPLLAQRPELSTPPTSRLALQEALHRHALHAAGQAPHLYAADAPVPPLALELLRGAVATPERAALAWTALDLLAALALAQCARAMGRRGELVAALYLFSPYTLLSSLAQSTTPLSNLFVIFSLLGALRGSRILLLPSLAASTLLSLYPILLAPPLLLLCAQRADGSVAVQELYQRVPVAHMLLSLVLFGGCLAGLLYSHFLRFGSWEFVERAYGTLVLLPDLTPNIGLWWYFFIEIFDHFRNFFLLAFNVHAASYSVPFTIKYANDPVFAIAALSGIVATCKSYPSMADTALFLGLLGLHLDLIPYLRYPLVSALLFLHASLLLPIFHHLWLSAGRGNANFFYAITLVWALASGAVLLDAMWAWGHRRWELERPVVEEQLSAEKGTPRTRTVKQV